MFQAPVRIWLKTLHCASPIKRLLQLPGTCKPKEGTNLSSGSSACKTPACPCSNFTYTTWKETQRKNHHLTTTSLFKLVLRGITQLPLETPLLPNMRQPAEPGFPDDSVAFSCLSMTQFN
ncbi:hypothetical protein ATANTOWER_010565 [Ataeniobius toweri]|uniref:Uncharacterized protein n=1 Tax=Ataeniobius toweri TaxID=208326 RepID=A0ABU7BFK9_9TELE|nr:hypothetical protein [Ataeniobius toweri]